MREKICIPLVFSLIIGGALFIPDHEVDGEKTRLMIDDSAYRLIPLDDLKVTIEDGEYNSRFYTIMGGLTVNSFISDAAWLTWEYTEPLGINTTDNEGYWSFDKGDATDGSGNGNDGTLHGPTSVGGISSFGQALSFEGNEYVDIPHDASLNITDEITVEAWIYPTFDDMGEHMIVSKGGSWSDEDPQCYELTFDKGLPLFQMKLPDSEDWYGIAPADPITRNTWHHVAGVYDGARFYIYIDGVNQTKTYTGWGGTYMGEVYSGGLPTGDFNISIGRRAPASWGSLFYEGYIDEVRIWDRAIPGWEIEQHAVIPGTPSLNLKGTPDNGDVGDYNVLINVTDGDNHFAEYQYDLTVENQLPNILTDPIEQIFQDEEYSVQYNSDEGSGVLTWGLITDAGWLSMDPSTGLLSGTPTNDDVGIQEVTVRFNDGNGGMDSSTFNLEVLDINDPPEISTENVIEALEDQYFQVDYDHIDIDGEDVTWTLVTDADWLSLDPISGILNGTPSNDDVGSYDVNIKAEDPRGLFNSTEFQLTVLNVNDIPVWVDVPENISVNEASIYLFDLNATDVDMGDKITYSISSDPAVNFTINGTTGVLEWTVSRFDFIDEIDIESVNEVRLDLLAKATDGEEVISHIFHLDVIFDPSPITTLISPLNGSTIGGPVILDWEGSDNGELPLTYDIYLFDSKSDVLSMNEWAMIGEGINETEFQVNDLEIGNTYFWTIIPHDQYSMGICIDEAFSFYLNSPPETTLISPKDEAVVSNHGLVLRCSGTDAELDTIEYHFYISMEIGDLENLTEKAHFIGTSSFPPQDIQPGVTYYWTVIGKDDYEFGECLNGIYRFTVNIPPEFDTIEDQEVDAGSDLVVDINGSDDDGDDLEFTILDGPSGLVIVPTTGIISWTTKVEDIGQYTVKVQISDGLDINNVSFIIDVKEATVIDDEDGDKDESSSVPIVIAVIAVVIILIIIVLIIFLLMRKKKEGEPEEQIPDEENQGDIPDYFLGEGETALQEDLYTDPLADGRKNAVEEDHSGDSYESIVPEALSEEEDLSRVASFESNEEPVSSGEISSSGSEIGMDPPGSETVEDLPEGSAHPKEDA